MDRKTNINELKEKVKKFCDDRDWDQFHGGKNLATALIVEAAELLEHFRWTSEEDANKLFENATKREEIEDEIADVFYFLLRLAQKYDIDLSESLVKKLKKNARRYPVEKARGSSKKYTEI